MAKRYKYETFTCIDYDDMMETYNQMYSKDYQLIGYKWFDDMMEVQVTNKHTDKNQKSYYFTLFTGLGLIFEVIFD